MRENSTFPSEESSEYTADMCLKIAAALDQWIEGQPAHVGVAHIETDLLALIGKTSIRRRTPTASL